MGKRAQADHKDNKNPQGRTKPQDLRNSRVVRGAKSARGKRLQKHTNSDKLSQTRSRIVDFIPNAMRRQ